MINDGEILRLALFVPGNESPYQLLLRPFEPTDRDRMILAKVLEALMQDDHGGLELRVIVDQGI